MYQCCIWTCSGNTAVREEHSDSGQDGDREGQGVISITINIVLVIKEEIDGLVVFGQEHQDEVVYHISN